MFRVLTAALALVAAGPVVAADLVPSGAPHGEQHGVVNPGGDPVSFTQNTDATTVTADNSIHCGQTGTPYHAPNSYLRRFDLADDHGIADVLTINSVDIAHETATTDAGEAQPVDVNLYTIPSGNAFTMAALTLIGTTTIMVPDGTSLAIENVPVSGIVDDPANEDLVVEVFTPDGRDPVFASYWAGSNALGQTAPSYVAAEACGLLEPTPFVDVGFPNVHLVMVVNGVVGTSPTVSSSWSHIKGLFR